MQNNPILLVIILAVIILVLTSCSTTAPSPDATVATDPVAQAVVEETTPQSESSTVSSPSLFQEAHRCQGQVSYQAEIQNGKMRSRLSCTWEVSPNEWGNW